MEGPECRCTTDMFSTCRYCRNRALKFGSPAGSGSNSSSRLEKKINGETRKRVCDASRTRKLWASCALALVLRRTTFPVLLHPNFFLLRSTFSSFYSLFFESISIAASDQSPPEILSIVLLASVI